MSNPLDTNAGKPSLDYLQVAQENWTRDDMNAVQRTSKVDVATGGDGGIEAVIPVGAEIIGVTVRCVRTTGGGTMQVQTGATVPVDISDVIVCATDKAITYAGEIDDANNVNIVGADGIKVFSNSASDGGIVYIHYLKQST